MGEVIATRDLEMKQDDGSVSKIRVMLEKPERASSGEFRCRFRIEGIEGQWPEYAGGEDSIQALVLALAMIDSSLKATDAGMKGKLSWLGVSDLGFTSTQLF